ncbi:MAG: outer membrane lipoprotein carrier protein LolA [Bacteroidales bacterium]|nr:outer membrane lipoprotein carrier protein LolA [Bacteroidales bacterium]
MKKLLICIAFSVFYPGFTNAGAMQEDFYARLAKISSDIRSLSGTFTQIKEIQSLDVKVVSEGNFSYEKNVEMRFDYLVPRKMSIVVDEKIVKIITEEKTSTFPLRGQKNAMAEMAQIMNLCMKGQLKELRQTYVLEYEKTERGHRVTIRSLKDDPSNAFDRIDLLFGLRNYGLRELVINERSGYRTTYVFSDVITDVQR